MPEQEKRRIHHENRKREFAFVETLAVLATGAFFAAGAGVAVIHTVELARTTAARRTIEQFQIALQSYYIDCGRFPSAQQGLEALWTKPILVPVPDAWNGPYLDHEVPSDPWGAEYIYAVKGSASFPTEMSEELPFVIISYGGDRMLGGKGNDADIVSLRYRETVAMRTSLQRDRCIAAGFKKVCKHKSGPDVQRKAAVWRRICFSVWNLDSITFLENETEYTAAWIADGKRSKCTCCSLRYSNGVQAENENEK